VSRRLVLRDGNQEGLHLKFDIDQLIGLRHWLHAHPEVSRQEVETAKHLRQFLETHATPDRVVPLHGAGFAAVYEGQSAGKTILLRCELDALPIHEINDNIPYRSIFDGVGHKCGHDGHMAILAGLAQTLAERPAKGRVVLLFQPDEETGTGARLSCSHPNFDQIKPDLVFALHNLPSFPLGQIVCKSGVFASEVRYVTIRMSGKEAHSAQPETGTSPSYALAELTLQVRKIQAKYDLPDAYALAVPVYNQMGVQASGISPARGEVHITLRSAQSDTVEKMWQDIQGCAVELAARYTLEAGFEIREAFTGTKNTELGFDMIRQAAAKTNHPFRCLEHPFRWGEDFGEFTNRFEGGMFGLGAGDIQPELHHPDYDFPDGIIGNGIAMFAEIIRSVVDQTGNIAKSHNGRS
jgi:amidohydrolase